jgi:hypothetical protein
MKRFRRVRKYRRLDNSELRNSGHDLARLEAILRLAPDLSWEDLESLSREEASDLVAMLRRETYSPDQIARFANIKRVSWYDRTFPSLKAAAKASRHCSGTIAKKCEQRIEGWSFE